MKETPTPKVTVYSAVWCAFCKTEKQYLDKLGVAYVSKDIEADPGAQDELIAKTNGRAQGIPVTDIDGEIIYGFDRAKIDQTLKAKSLL
ncbi:MAG: glutaredoxin domain-containing protein [Candidatus Saccharimonas sp.]